MQKHARYGKMAYLASTILTLTMMNVPEVTAQDNKNYAIEEVIITAQRRATNLQSTPIALTAVTSAKLEARGAEDLSNLAGIAPNVQFEGSAPLSGGSFNATVFIRGIGQNDSSVFSDPGVGIYLDGVYLGRSSGSILDLADIERVEVLRGPQGTLFGKNAIGGAVNVISKRPGDEFEANVSLTGGSYDRLDAIGTVSGPITDKLKARVTVGKFNRDGYVDRVLDNTKLGGKDTLAAKALFVYDASDNLEFDLGFDYTRTRQDSAAQTLLSIDETGSPFLDFTNSFIAPTAGFVAPNGENTLNPSYVPDDPFISYGTGPNQNDLDQFGVNLTAKWDVNDTISIKSISAYREVDAIFGRDGDGTPFTFRETLDDLSQSQFSQELQLTGSAFNERLHYTLGAYYYNEKAEDLARINLASGLYGATEGILPDPTRVAVDLVFDQYVNIETDSYAAFGEFSYDVTDRLTAIVGLRYTDETKVMEAYELRLASGAYIVDPAELEVIYGRYPLKESWSDTSPRFGLNYQVSHDVFAYATVSKGFKSGSFNGRATATSSEIAPFNPEIVWNYEGGMKFELFDRRLVINTAAFWMDYTDIQVTVNRTPANFVENAAEATIKGVELEFNAMPTPGFLLEGAVGLLDAEYTLIGDANLPITKDSALIRAPDVTANLGASYTFNIGDAAGLTLRGDWRYTGQQSFDAANNPLITQDGYSLFNARLTYQDIDDNWSASFYVNNLTDKLYLISGNAASGAFGNLTEGTYGRPREWGITLEKSF
jgi:iron complex outermembrane receptor protein